MQDATLLDTPAPYPVRLHADYPERLSRLSTFFRIILAIPVWLFIYLIQANIIAAIWAAVLVRGRIPRWLFDFQVGYNRFATRAFAYFWLLEDKYPPFEGDWGIRYEVDYPERISRWKLFLWKLITAIPHFFVLIFLFIAAGFCVFIAWFAILFTGKFPRGLHTFVVGVMRWGARVTAYVESLTDVFPPFSLDEDAGSGSAQAISATIGVAVVILTIAGAAAIGAVVYNYSSETETQTVSLDDAFAGDIPSRDAIIEFDDITFELVQVEDPYTSDILAASADRRLVAVTLTYSTERGRESELRDRDLPRRREGLGSDIGDGTIRLETDERTQRPLLLTVDGLVAPVDIRPLEPVTIIAVFDVREDEDLVEIHGYTGQLGRHVVWELE
jgi:hypothetical protein